MQASSVAVIIPARFQSSRFPGKPLALIAGTSLIQRVWGRCVAAVDPSLVFVATDDERIASHCRDFDAQVILTSPDCLTGTDRIAEVSHQIEADVYINVQGDEPLVHADDILKVIDAFRGNPESVVCAMCPIESADEFISLTVPKVVVREDGRLLYMSRAGIPGNKSGTFAVGMKQVCIYAFSKVHLAHFSSYPKKTPLEQLEDIEILRFLETGVPVQMIPVSGSSLAVDTPEDIWRVETRLQNSGERS